MWWNKAAELVSSFQRYRSDEDYQEYDEDDEKKGLMLPVLLRKGVLEFIRVKPGLLVKELLKSLSAKASFGLVHTKLDVFNRIVGRRILEGDEKLEELEGVNWKARTPDVCNIWLVDLTQEVTVLFNTYFRMATGVPNHLQRLYLEPGMTVSEFEVMLKDSLSLPIDDFRFGLYGYDQRQVVQLDGDILMSELLEMEKDPANPSYFQFQFHPESESDSFLGTSRASNLFMRANRGTRRMKKCWFSLQGTTMFYRPSQYDHTWVRKIERVDQCKIVYRGGNKERTAWRFDVVPPEGHGPIRVFTSPLKRRVVRWVRELRVAHATQEINEPVTMEMLREQAQKGLIKGELEPSSHLSCPHVSDTVVSELQSYQKRLLEMAEALLHKVELDGGVLLMNGLDRIDEDLGRKWVDNVRELLYHCLKIQATKTAAKVMALAREILKQLRDWVQYFEDLEANDGSMSPPPAPLAETIKHIIEDSANLVHTFRFYAINLNNDEDLIRSRKEKHSLEEMLETLQDALANSIFAGKQRRRRVIRGTFRSKEELKEIERHQREREAAEERARKAEKEKEKRRKMREKKGISSVWKVVDSNIQVDADADELAFKPRSFDDDSDLHAEAADDGTSQKSFNWIRKLGKYFKRKNMRRNPYEIEYREEDEIADDASFHMSMENGERLSEGRWSETKEMFRKYSKKNQQKEHGEEGEHGQTYIQLPPMPDSPIIRSGFNRFGSIKKTERTQPAWQVPHSHEEDSNETMSVEEVLSPSEPIRAGPEEEAMLLRMLKDPRVKGLLQEYKENQMSDPELAPKQEAMASWGRRRHA